MWFGLSLLPILFHVSHGVIGLSGSAYHFITCTFSLSPTSIYKHFLSFLLIYFSFWFTSPNNFLSAHSSVLSLCIYLYVYLSVCLFISMSHVFSAFLMHLIYSQFYHLLFFLIHFLHISVPLLSLYIMLFRFVSLSPFSFSAPHYFRFLISFPSASKFLPALSLPLSPALFPLFSPTLFFFPFIYLSLYPPPALCASPTYYTSRQAMSSIFFLNLITQLFRTPPPKTHSNQSQIHPLGPKSGVYLIFLSATTSLDESHGCAG
jgi:hypothetical protein